MKYCFKIFSSTCYKGTDATGQTAKYFVKCLISENQNIPLFTDSIGKVRSLVFLAVLSCGFDSSILSTHMSGRFCKICLKEAQATTWASEGRLASDWVNFLTIVFKHWWAAFKSLSNCCHSICRARWLQMFLNSTLSWKEQQKPTSN